MKKLFYAALILAVTTSCDIVEFNGKAERIFTATIVKPAKDALNDKSSWVPGDEITITDNSSISVKYTVSTIDEQGKATLAKKDGESGELGSGPYTAIFGTAPATRQTYGAPAPTLPLTAESATTELSFAVTGGIVEFTVTAASAESVKNVKQIDVRATPAGGTETIYTLICSTPQSIISGAAFRIALPAGTYNKVYVTNGAYLCDTTATASVAVTANAVQSKAVADVAFRYAKDILCNVYPIVTIGTQIWMAENLKCDKYDTESEVYNEDPDGYFLNHNYIIPQPQPSTPTFKDTLKTPYYTDATDTTTWSRRAAAKKQQTALSPTQRAKLGYSYNWAAVVGVATDLLRTTPFTGNRQGICPNGWHVPDSVELAALKTKIEVTDGKGADTAGGHLKSSSGWYDANNPSKYPQGTDTYGFNLLPAGLAAADSLSNIGAAGHIATATPGTGRPDKFCYAYGSYTNQKFVDGNGAPKCNGRSLRCLKNN